jgi:hypothetical protein
MVCTPSLRRYLRLHNTREHSANQVYVTGTFDDWMKTVKLEKEDGVFKKTVELPKAHIQYKVCVRRAAFRRPPGFGCRPWTNIQLVCRRWQLVYQRERAQGRRWQRHS